MELKKAIEVLKERSEWIKKHLPESPHAKAIDTVVAHLNTENISELDENLDEKAIETPDSQASLSNKKDRLYTDKDMEAFAEWASNEGWQYLWYYKCWQNNTSIYQKTTAQLREMWEQERRAK